MRRPFRRSRSANVDRVWSVDGNNSHEPTTPDVLIAGLAARQHGVVTVAQLLAAGLDHDAIAYRRHVGRLHLLHRGVYAVGHRPPSPLATAIGAVLACGPHAALSHRSAAALWRILPRWTSPIEVTTPTKRGHPVSTSTAPARSTPPPTTASASPPRRARSSTSPTSSTTDNSPEPSTRPRSSGSSPRPS